MEFNVLQHFKGLENIPKDPFNANEVGTVAVPDRRDGPPHLREDGWLRCEGWHVAAQFPEIITRLLRGDDGRERSHRHEVLRSRRGRGR